MNYGNDSTDTNYKILIIGEAGTGKTCLLTRFTDDKFDEQDVTSSTYSKTVTVDIPECSRMKKITLEIFDTAGQERFRTLTSSFYRKSCGIFLVYDISDETSFKNLTNWAKDIEYYATPKSVKILLGNKSDLDEKKVTKDEGDDFAKDKSFESHAIVSAKTGDGCKEALKAMALQVGENFTGEEESAEGVVDIGKNKEEGGKKKKFCSLM